MARPIKQGLDYFPLDTDVLRNRKVRQIKRAFGGDGFMLFIALLCDIYEKGYYVEFSDGYVFDLADELDGDESRVREMVAFMVKIGVFDARLFNERGLLTSASIQTQYVTIKRRLSVEQLIDEDIRLISPAKPPVSDTENTQSKEKESKGNYLKENNLNENIENNLKEKQSEEKENRGMIITSTTPAREARIEECEVVDVETADSFEDRCERYRGELLRNGNWLASIERCSGKGRNVLERELPRAMDLFENHIISICETDTLRSVKDYGRRFVSWWRRLNFETSEEIVNLGKSSTVARTCATKQAPSRVEDAMAVARRAGEMACQMLKAKGYGSRHETLL